jgi:hypothetical protein
MDVTDDLVDLFHGSGKGLACAKGIRSHSPEPSEQIADNTD